MDEQLAEQIAKLEELDAEISEYESAIEIDMESFRQVVQLLKELAEDG